MEGTASSPCSSPADRTRPVLRHHPEGEPAPQSSGHQSQEDHLRISAVKSHASRRVIVLQASTPQGSRQRAHMAACSQDKKQSASDPHIWDHGNLTGETRVYLPTP